MAGEVCARCLWTGPATSAPNGLCPVCGSPVTPSSVGSSAGSSAASGLAAIDAAARLATADTTDTTEMTDAPTNLASASEIVEAEGDDVTEGPADAVRGNRSDTDNDTDNDRRGVDLDSVVGSVRAKSGGLTPQTPISRGRWALLVVNVALLVVCVALVFATALGWRVGVAGAANIAAPGGPTATTTTSPGVAPSIAPSVAPGVLSDTPTATTTPTPVIGGSGGGAPPTATPAPQPTRTTEPSPTPTLGTPS